MIMRTAVERAYSLGCLVGGVVLLAVGTPLLAAVVLGGLALHLVVLRRGAPAARP